MNRKEVTHYEEEIARSGSDKAAEDFVNKASLADYDLSGMKALRFEFSLRMSVADY